MFTSGHTLRPRHTIRQVTSSALLRQQVACAYFVAETCRSEFQVKFQVHQVLHEITYNEHCLQIAS